MIHDPKSTFPSVYSRTATNLINQPEVVRDQQDASLVPIDRVSQSVYGLHVEMVGRLVQQQHVRHLPRQPGKDHAALLAVRQLLHRSGLGLAGDAVAADNLVRIWLIYKTNYYSLLGFLLFSFRLAP